MTAGFGVQMSTICRSPYPDCVSPSGSFRSRRHRVEMQTRLPRRVPVASSSTASLSRSRAQAKRNAHLSATASHIPRPKRNATVSFVANCDPPVSLNEPIEKDTVHSRDDVKQDPDGASSAVDQHPASPKGPFLADRLESTLSQLWIYFFVVGITLGIVVMFYPVLDVMTEAQLRILALVFILWNWTQRVADLRKPHRVRRSIALAVRLAVLYVALSFGPFQLHTFVFAYHPALFPIAAIFAVFTACGHWLLLFRSQTVSSELQKPDCEWLIPLFTEDIDSIQKVERRVSMIWVYLSGVLVVPFLQEILYRGIVVVSLELLFGIRVASCVAALAYNASRPIASPRQFLATFFSGYMWGVLAVTAKENLIFPVVAHIMHNALLFAAHHRKSLLECF